MKYVTDDGKSFDNYEIAIDHEKAMKSPARTLTFSGYSDDLVHVENFANNRETEEFSARIFDLIAAEGPGLRITAVYDGCWSFAPGLLDEDEDLPEWIDTFSLAADGYTVKASISVPEGVLFKVRI